jgi:hypothetical protein
MRGSRLRQGFAGATSSLGRRSFSEGGKPAHDGVERSRFFCSSFRGAATAANYDVQLHIGESR